MRKIHVSLTDEIGKRLDEWVAAANDKFDEGRVNHSDCIEHMLTRGKPDLDILRRKKTNVTKFLLKLARDGTTDVDAVIQRLRGLKEQAVRSDRKADSRGDEA